MIQERRCSYEVSKLLKEKGFNEETLSFYIPYEDGEVKLVVSPNKANYNAEQDWLISAPTHQMVLEWLRKKYIFIEISVSIDLNGDYHYSYSILDKDCKYVRKGYTSFEWNHEDAIEEALKYVLENLI